MKNYQQSLVQLLEEENLDFLTQEMGLLLKTMSSVERARLLTDLSFLITALRFIRERYWILNKEDDKEHFFGGFVKKFFKKELSPVLFIHNALENSKVDLVEKMRENAQHLQKILLVDLASLSQAEHLVFSSTCVKLMSDLYEFEYQIKMGNDEEGDPSYFELDRTFDVLDDVLGLDYESESDVDSQNKERLSLNSGLGVQSSYGTILLALRYLRLAKSSRIIDLGSGFGRVGLAAGLLYPDIQFSGFEYLESRVRVANQAAEKLGINKRVCFYQQDLSVLDFLIPEAEIYYLYDPFSDETYTHVLNRISQIGHKKAITVIAKGAARERMEALIGKASWQKPQNFKNENFSLFRTRGNN